MNPLTALRIPFGVNEPAKPDNGEAPKKASSKSVDSPETKAAFQKFVAGTFFKQMLKAMRQTQHKPAYFHGGQAEEIFRGQMDQEVAEQLATDRGGALSESLYQAFANQLRSRVKNTAAQPDAASAAK